MDNAGNGTYISDEKLWGYAASSAMLEEPDGLGSGAKCAGSIRRAMRDIDRACADVRRRWVGAERMPAACEWLLDNRYLAKREADSAAEALKGEKGLRLAGGRPLIAALCAALADAGLGQVTSERCGIFLRGYQSVRALTQQELSLFPAALRGALIERLARQCAGLENGAETCEKAFADVFTSLRLISSVDLAEMLDGANAVEQALRRDPSGVYPLMDEDSRAAYRAEVTALAEKFGTDERSAAEKALSLAESAEAGLREAHVGYWLFERPLGAEKKVRNGGWYIGANVVLTLFLSLLAGFAADSPWAALLLLLPVSELVKSLLDFILRRTVKPAFIPRLALEDGVPESGRTICVVSALLTSPAVGRLTAEKLERFHILSRDCGENLVFGILADLKESQSAEEPEDKAILDAAASAVAALNKKYGGGFYLFTRPREYSRRDGVYRPRERKRGAVTALAALVCGGEDGLTVREGDGAKLRGAKYILTLDSDTELLPGTARKLIGAMLHPLNAPRVENGAVSSGRGLIHPRIGVEIKSAAATEFSRVYAGQGGIDPYSGLCGELYMDLFGRGGFAGKGIIDAAALLQCCSSGFPEDFILSHDALEGAYLRGGYMSDCEVTDGFPTRPLSFFRRLGRWTRGDWQNLPWLFSRGRALSDIDRWKLFDSIRRSLAPPLTFAAVAVGFFTPRSGLVLAALAALLALLTNLFFALAEDVMQPSGARIRYHSVVIRGLGGAIMLTFIRLWLLPFEAWVCLTSAARSLWRMAVSRRKLLQWETAAQTDADPNSLRAHYAAMWFCPLAGLCCLLFSPSVIGRTAGLMWLTAPAAAWALSLPARAGAAVTGAQRRFLTDCARDIWEYFDKFCSPEDNFLPPDNYQEQPPVGLAHRTSPTNIGLALTACLAAMELGIDDGLTAAGHVENMLAAVEKLPKWRGHLYNWYDTRTLRPLEPAGVSTVDSGNLCACLTALAAGLRKRQRPDLALRAEALSRGMDFAALYDKSRRLMYIGYDVRREKPYGGWYDLMASEARLTSYIAVARGEADERHWRRLSRAQLGLDGYRGLASWTGTMFEYLMPELFLPLYPDSLLYESAKFCLYAQKRRVGRAVPWGISESAFFALDPALNYRYKASGCQSLALKRGQDQDLVVSPYSSFLALCCEPGSAVRNLRRLKKRGAAGRFGFYEAVDFTRSRCRGGDGELVRCYMSHHQGMSIAAIANLLCGGVMRELFMSDPEMSAYRCLLQERVPTGGALLRRDGSSVPEKSRRENCEKWEIRGQGADFDSPACCLLSNGVYSIMSTEYGLTRSVCRDMLVYDSPANPADGHGLELALNIGGRRVSLLPEPGCGGGILWELSEDAASVGLDTDDFSSKCTAASASGFSGEIRLVRLEARRGFEGELELSFAPVLADGGDWESHPAFWRLGMEARVYKGCLLIRRLRRGSAPEVWLCLACGCAAEFSADARGGLGWLSYPLVRAKIPVSLKPGERLGVRFALCLGQTAEEAYTGAQRLTALGPADYGSMPSACAALSGMSALEVGEAMAMVGPLWFPRPARLCQTDELWRYSLSGDLPIIMLSPGQPGDVDAPIRRFCLLRCCGVLSDLAVVTDDGGEYSRPVSRRTEDVLLKLGLGPLLGSWGGVHLLPASAYAAIRSSAAVICGEAYKPRTVNAGYFPRPKGRSGGVPEHTWSADCFEFYVNRFLPARCWSDVLCCGDFGYIAADSGCGGMWYANAREGRISPWLNDPLAVSGPETLEIETGSGRYSLFAAEDGFPCRVRFGFGWASWEKDFGAFKTLVTAFTPLDGKSRVLTVETGSAPGRILWKTELLLASESDDRGGTAIEYSDGAFTAENTRSYLPGLKFSAAFSAPPSAFTCCLGKWRRGVLDCGTDTGGQPIMGAAFPAGPLTIVCGCRPAGELSELCKQAPDALSQVREHWRRLLGRLSFSGLGGAMERMMNGWAGYQAICCRLLARSSLYQSGGAFGFRDQLQDAVNVMLLDPAPARKQIILSCRHQYLQGDVMHWWHQHPNGDRGVRTRCSDDLLWLCWALCEYVEKTGDAAICAEEAPYLVSEPLSEGEHDRYETPAVSEKTGTVLEHAALALEQCVGRGTGPHGLLKFGSGDWNDGMDRVFGESVWLTWFFSCVCQRYSRLLELLCKPDSGKYAALAESMGRAADAAWDGSWYLRGYWPDGEPIGSRQSRCCELDSISQSWAALCPYASPQKADAALDAAVERLFDRKTGVVKLFDPPFADCRRSPGYIESCGPGFRENGGQYTHGAIWLAIACLRRGRIADGRAILEALLPENHDLERYLAEPFVLPADVYSAPGHEGEAGWTWYTGSAGWYFRAVAEELMGLRMENGVLSARPLIDGASVSLISPDGARRAVGGKSE
jgi:cyclic beta-1,2-glucan synthetase